MCVCDKFFVERPFFNDRVGNVAIATCSTKQNTALFDVIFIALCICTVCRNEAETEKSWVHMREPSLRQIVKRKFSFPSRESNSGLSPNPKSLNDCTKAAASCSCWYDTHYFLQVGLRVNELVIIPLRSSGMIKDYHSTKRDKNFLLLHGFELLWVKFPSLSQYRDDRSLCFTV